VFKLFHSIFGGERGTHYPHSLIEAAIERVVDGTDPRLRALSGYRKQLREPVIHAIDHVVSLVDGMPAPLLVNRQNFSSEPQLRTLFASVEHMQEILGADPAVSAFRASGVADSATVLLLAERVERQVLGVELQGELLRRDVAQVTVNFSGQRLVDPAAEEIETRRLLKRRAFDHLIALALARIADAQEARAGLSRQRDALRHKRDTLQQCSWGFEERQGPDSTQVASELHKELAAIDAGLAALHADSGVLGEHLRLVAEQLAQAESQLWAEDISLCLDKMNIQRDRQDASATEIPFRELHNARGRRLVMQLLTIPFDELPQPEDFFAAVERYLR
jgi:hypothetical protein